MHTLAPGRRALALAALLSISLGVSALDKPKGKPILALSGQISQTNAPQQAQFDMAMLAALPQHSFSTQTPWYPKPVKFTGPLLRDVLRDVLRAAGARGNTIVAVALNDYKTEIPFQDAMQYGVIVARLMNDKPMPVREKDRYSSSIPSIASPSYAPPCTTTAQLGSCAACKSNSHA